MLVLSRGTDQTICIGPDIEITIVETRGNQVRLGIRAPQHVKVRRSELVPHETETPGKDTGDAGLELTMSSSRGMRQECTEPGVANMD